MELTQGNNGVLELVPERRVAREAGEKNEDMLELRWVEVNSGRVKLKMRTSSAKTVFF